MTRNRKGFTLIELLIVVVIIGILAAIAIPKFANTKEKAYIAAMKSDLRNLATAQENYFSEQQTTSASYGTLAQLTTSRYNPSTAVTVTATGSSQGWNATATRAGTTKQCVMWVGATSFQLTPTGGSAANEGEPSCTP